MRHAVKIALGIILLFFISLVITMLIGQYLRGTISNTTVSFTATPTTYECGDGSCIGFIVTRTLSSEFSVYEGKLIFPYSEESSKDQLENHWAHLLTEINNTVCFNGYVHNYPVNTLRLFQYGHGGYRFNINDYRKGPC